jgi:hypothetical protein
MTLATRISRMEIVTAASERVLRLIASDEADLHRQFEDLLLTTQPGPVILDIEVAGVQSRQPHTFLTHEEALELIR